MRKAIIVSRTIRGVEKRQMFSALRKVVKPSDFSALSKIQVPREAESASPSSPDEVAKVLENTAPDNMIWDTVFEWSEIEAHLLTYNREAFRAAAESPCGKGVLHDALTFTSLSQESEELLAGIIPEEWTKDMICCANS